jgi:hypothetical protein
MSAATHMTLGYAMCASPNQYDSVGRNTFQVSNSGTIYQQDQGAASPVTTYNASQTTNWVVSQ